MRFLLACNYHNCYLGHTKPLFIQKKQTNCYLIVVTSRLWLNGQVIGAHSVYACDISFYCFLSTSKYLQRWLLFETPDWSSSVKLSYHVYLLMIPLHHYLSLVLMMLLFQPRVFVDDVISTSCCSWCCCWWWWCQWYCFLSVMLIYVDANDDDDDATLDPCYERWCYWWWEKLSMICRYANQCSICWWCCCALSLSWWCHIGLCQYNTLLINGECWNIVTSKNILLYLSYYLINQIPFYGLIMLGLV